MNSKSKRAIYMNVDIDLEMTAIITYKYNDYIFSFYWIILYTFMKSSDLSNLETLSTLKVLKILTLLKALMAEFVPDMKINSTMESITMQPSNIFILSRTQSNIIKENYFLPGDGKNILRKFTYHSISQNLDQHFNSEKYGK